MWDSISPRSRRTKAAVGLRVFNVIMNGAEAFHNLDIFATVGCQARLHAGENPYGDRRHIRISFVNVPTTPRSRQSPSRARPCPREQGAYRVNLGGNDYYDAKATPGKPIGISSAIGHATLVKIAGTQNQPLYTTTRERSGQDAAAIIFDLVPGDYTVRLHFAEAVGRGRKPGQTASSMSRLTEPSFWIISTSSVRRASPRKSSRSALTIGGRASGRDRVPEHRGMARSTP